MATGVQYRRLKQANDRSVFSWEERLEYNCKDLQRVSQELAKAEQRVANLRSQQNGCRSVVNESFYAWEHGRIQGLRIIIEHRITSDYLKPTQELKVLYRVSDFPNLCGWRHDSWC